MDVKVAHIPKFSPWMEVNTVGRMSCCSLQLPWRSRNLKRPEVLISVDSYPSRRTYGNRRLISMEVSCSKNNFSASALQWGSLDGPASPDGSLALKSKIRDIEPYISGRCIFLVGMMGSGKTTVGKIVSQILGYSFVDCCAVTHWLSKKLGEPPWPIFLSFMEKASSEIRRRYMHKGLSVWLDVPLDALAKRIAAVGTHSRPLLHGESGDAYTKALNRLSSLFKERGEAYANANARVSLEEIAAKHGYRDVSFITPEEIAIEAIEQLEHHLKDAERVTFDTL